MGKHGSKWGFAAIHGVPSLLGLLRLFVTSPLWTLKLLKARTTYFRTRELRHPLKTPDNFVIESTGELVSYWNFFVEHECWDDEFVNALRAQSKPVILDVGANAGLFTHWMWLLKPDAQFIVFEPLPKMANKITEWGVRTGADIVLHQKAVSDHCGTAEFYSEGENDLTAGLRPVSDKSLKLTVPLTTLDTVVPDKPILLAKVDVEGFECEVLSGGRRTMSRTRFLIIEAHTPDALARIQKLLGTGWRTKAVGASDYLMIHEAEVR
jgi:FkbM family methyltransferase